MVRDDDIRSSCFAHLSRLQAEFGAEIPYLAGLDRGFPFRGQRVPYLNRQKGIFRAAAQRGPAALAIQTSAKSPYADAETDLGFAYDYRAGSVDLPDNRALRAAYVLGVPVVYFVGTRPGWYTAHFPYFVEQDDPRTRQVLIGPGTMAGALDEPTPLPIADVVERRYAVREAKVRLHQARFRGLVLPAYSDRCAICRLKEVRLLDAAHITDDAVDEGPAAVVNGVSLCTIHHRAYDQDLIGLSPDYTVHVAPRLLDDEDGPMLELLKRFHDADLHIPERRTFRPNRERLAARFERFAAA